MSETYTARMPVPMPTILPETNNGTESVPLYVQTVLPGLRKELFIYEVPMGMMHTIRHGEQQPIEAVRYGEEPPVNVDTTITPPIFDRTHPDYLENLKKRNDRRLSKKGRQQIRDYVIQSFWPDFTKRVPNGKNRKIQMGFSDRIRTQSSADVAASVLEKFVDEDREYRGINPYDEIKKVLIKMLNTTFVVDSIEKKLYEKNIDKDRLQGPDIKFSFVKYWVNSSYNRKIAKFFKSKGIPTPYVLGRMLFNELVYRNYKESKKLKNTQISNLDFTHETSLYALFIYLAYPKNPDDIPLMNNGDFMQFDFYKDNMIVSLNDTVLRILHYSYDQPDPKKSNEYHTRKVKRKQESSPYTQSNFLSEENYG